MSFPDDDLLQPSLTRETVAKAPYSVQTMFLTSFFGGPFAAIAIIGVNSVRLQRISRDVVPLVVAAVGYTAWIVMSLTEPGMHAMESVCDALGERGPSHLSRLAGVILCGLGYLLHRREQRSATFMGLPRPNGLIAGLLCFSAGLLLPLAIVFLIGAATAQ